ncbi:MAG: TIGR00341 family protein, partial [Chromatiales bacterium]|nr:TIGR00341 family protein [Chromatiales bacterium]
MKYVEVVADSGSSSTVLAIAEKAKAQDFRVGIVGEDGQQQMRLLVGDDKIQWVLDALQNILGAQPSARILVLAVEASLPRLEEDERKQESSAISAREALYEEVEKNARLNRNFLILVMLSTVVAAIGLIENNIAVVIGAMVIAPLLGPNLALSLGTALGDMPLMRESVITLLTGILLALLISFGLGYFWPTAIASSEMMARTEVGWDSIALALASGAAAALSLTTGLSSVLVGVMVAVALLP